MPDGLVGVTIESMNATVTVEGDPFAFSDFAAVLIPKGSTAAVSVTTNWPFKWFWKETLFGTVQG